MLVTVARAGRGGGSIFPVGEAPVRPVAVFWSRLLGRARPAAAAAPRFARLERADVAAVVADLKGDARWVVFCLSGEAACLVGDGGCGASLMGERGRVRELCERGESTPIGLPVSFVFAAGFFWVFDAARFGAGAIVVALWYVVAAVLARFAFFWTGRALLSRAVLDVSCSVVVSGS